MGFVDALHKLVWIRGRMLASKNMNARSQLIFWDNINLKNKSDVVWLFNWCKKKPKIFLNIIHGTVQQLTENNESDTVIFSLKDFMELEFKFWLCNCEHEYLKLVKVTLFENLVEHNVIYDHNIFACQELIYSEILRITVVILKLFIDERNSWHIHRVSIPNFTTRFFGCIRRTTKKSF